jgi:hypothetical protein
MTIHCVLASFTFYAAIHVFLVFPRLSRSLVTVVFLGRIGFPVFLFCVLSVLVRRFAIVAIEAAGEVSLNAPGHGHITR